MATTRVTRRPGGARTAPWAGLILAVLLVAAAVVVPLATGWDVHARSDPDGSVPPLHGTWDPILFGPGTVPALLLAVLGWRYAVDWSQRLPWRRLLVAAYAAGLAWMLALALIDGPDGISRVMRHGYEYMLTAREITDVRGMLEVFVDRIPGSNPDHWVTHVAGHPPGALLFFVALVRLGLGGDLTAGLVICALAATTAPAVLTTVRALGAESAARRAAPFLVLGPAAVLMAVSADAVFAAVAAWGLAALALGATAVRWGKAVAWSALAGFLLGWCVMFSYGLPLLAFLAVAVLLGARRWLPLPIAAVTATGVVLVFAGLGFVWWEAYPVLHDRYWSGIAADRPAAYWMWGNLGALLICAGPLLGAGLAMLAVPSARRERVVTLLVAGAATAVLLADLSRMSKGEVERIWLPFVPWLLLSTALLPESWRRWGLALQLATALVLEILLFTSW